MTLDHSDTYKKLKGEFYRKYLSKPASEKPFAFKGIEFTIFFDKDEQGRYVQSISASTNGIRYWLADIHDISEAFSMAFELVQGMGLLNDGGDEE